ncbi:MAG: ATP-binding cassette domain-containing protein [Burkholderiaceae bacterium]|nr:ATP-binding cassette domain-containing protein [Burkholderiaceae bacterium]
MSGGTIARAARRRWQAPEVIQSSTMDCGPASLKCLLEGFGTPIGYDRLREACQTGVDGTSIDTLEAVAVRLGLQAEQVMIPPDHLRIDPAGSLPAMVVTRLPDGSTHFVVAWRRVGDRLQVMDPASGRRWVRIDAFIDSLLRHDLVVRSSAWREWAATDDFLRPLHRRIVAVGASIAKAREFIAQALAIPHWFALATLDAATRMVATLVTGGGLRRGRDSLGLLEVLCRQTSQAEHDIFRAIPPSYWSVVPDPRRADDGEAQLVLRGVVLMRVASRSAAPDGNEPIAPELSAALAEKPARPFTTAWSMLREDGLLAPLALAGAVMLAVAVTLVEAVLLRSVFDLSWSLNRPDQRLYAALALLVFLATLIAIETPIVTESLRLGRALETRLRMALLARLPLLHDRYFQSRPISDMAERAHALHLSRAVPLLALNAIQLAFELGLTLLGVALIDPASLPFALALAVVAIVLPAGAQAALGELDLRQRTHAAALGGFHLDALLGLRPIRAHRAEAAIVGQHEALLVEWAKSARNLLRASTFTGVVQGLVCTGLAAALLVAHFARAGGVTGVEILLVYWTLKLPAIGQRMVGLALQYPARRNVLRRLLEPIGAATRAGTQAGDLGGTQPSAMQASEPATGIPAPSRQVTEPGPRAVESPVPAVSVRIEGGRVVAGGHTILEQVELAIEAGEHVAVVGASGAGKSTLVGLLLGWHRLAAGTMHIDGAPATDARIEALRRRTAWVDPAVQLWNRPLAENLTYAAGDAAMARIGSVLDAADLRDLLRRLPAGLQTYLGEGGGLLSGGEGQRVRLARAMLQADVGLALLDEPFRGLDAAVRASLLADVRRWWRDATMICVTHDVESTTTFDRVLVVDGGELVEDGAPAVLAGADSRYRALLDAERALRSQWHRAGQWRRIVVAHGRIAHDDGARGARAARGPNHRERSR